MSKRAFPANPSTLNRNDFVSRSDVEILMAKRLRVPGESEAKVRERVTDNLNYAVHKAKRRKLPPPTRKGWRVGEIGAYLRKAYSGKFLDWPIDHRLAGSLDGEWLTGVSDDQPLPNDLATCHAEIRQQQRRITRLELKLAELRNSLDRQWQAKAETSRKRSEDGKKARGIPKRRGN